MYSSSFKHSSVEMDRHKSIGPLMINQLLCGYVCAQLLLMCHWMCLKETSLRVTSSLPPTNGKKQENCIFMK